MKDRDEQILSAQVVVKPGDGREPLAPEQVTAENVKAILPSSEDFQKARRFFADAGFEVDAGFANSFSITGRRELFEKTFGAASGNLPLGKLPAEIVKIVAAATFTEPPDFGPGNF